MIGIIDPAFLLYRSSEEVEQEINALIRICKKHVISVEPIEEYWPRMWKELGQKLEPKLQPGGRQAIQQLRQLGSRPNATQPAPSWARADIWKRGFRQLFAKTVMGSSWEADIAAAMVRVLHAGRDVILLTRRMDGRNVLVHAAGHSVVHENTRWVLHVDVEGMGHRQIRCIYNSVNFAAPWTTRFDVRLPRETAKTLYPFCPPEQWWKGSIGAVRTTQSKPAWRDRYDNGWCRPNIPGGAGYHWDVFLSENHATLVGLSQINVVEAGSKEGVPGTLHHVPSEKAGKITGSGWSCQE